MSTSSTNEPTEGHGGLPVYDKDGLYVGRVQSEDEPEAPSEDMARILVHVSEEAMRATGLQVRDVDLDPTWLHADRNADHLELDRPLVDALREQGFDL